MLLLISLVSCESTEKENRWNEDTLAEVYGRVLTTSELENKGIDIEKDSILLWTLFVDQWIRDELFHIQAEKKLEEQQEIDELVSSYRKSLMIHYYEQQLIKEQLDSIVLDTEIVQYYEDRKDNFILNTPIVQAKWIQTQSSNFNADTVKHYWNREKKNADRLEALCELYSRSYNLNDSLWLTLKELSMQSGLSVDRISKLNVNEFYNIDLEGGQQLMIKIGEKRKEGSLPPISYVNERIERILLHDRKQEILKSYRQRIYQEAIQERKVKMYIQ